jgi:hypothetical protein
MANAEYYRDRRSVQRLLCLCYQCNAATGGGALCPRCQILQRGPRGKQRPKRAYHCRLCGGEGHNARRCREEWQEDPTPVAAVSP